MTSPAGRRVDVAGLLTIDVTSELRKLSQAQFQGPWQLPAELVRRAVRGGARDIAVQVGRGSISVTHDGPGIDSATLDALSVVLGDHQPGAARHRALTSLESRGELALLGLAGLRCRRLEISTVEGRGVTRLEFRRGRSPTIRRGQARDGDTTTIAFRHPSLDPRQVTQWLTSVARFCHVPVRIGRRHVASGFDDAIDQGSLPPPYRGRIGLVRGCETARLWLLEHGVVTGHVMVPAAPAFEVAVELGSAAVDLNPSRLRDQVSPHVATLLAHGVDLVLRVSGRVHTLVESDRAQVGRVVLDLVRREIRAEDARRLAVFRVVREGVLQWSSLAALQDGAVSDGRGSAYVFALFPGQRPERYSAQPVPTLVADEAERSRIATLLGVAFRPPHRRAAALGRTVVWRRAWLRRLRDRWEGVKQIVRGGRLRPVAAEALDERERGFLEAVRRELAELSIRGVSDAVFCEGADEVRVGPGGSGTLRLPRHQPLVVESVAAYARDPAWLYVAMTALLGSRGVPTAATRARWLSGAPPQEST